MTGTLPDLDALRARLADGVADLSGPWDTALRTVGRDRFVPDRIWVHDRAGTGRLVPLDRSHDATDWLRRVYSDRSIITQVDDGHPQPDGTGWEATSSTSEPSVMAVMLDALDAEPGVRLLEVGTGTGWNAALLAHRLGAGQVASIEVDPALAAAARRVLACTGNPDVVVRCADGADGWVDRAPWDRILATASVWTVPPAWPAQTRPGGRIVVPVAGTLRHPGILTLDVHDDAVATGRLRGDATFMTMRAQRRARLDWPHQDRATADRSTTELHPYWVSGDRDAAVTTELRLPGLWRAWSDDPDQRPGAGREWLRDPTSGSWAVVDLDGTDGPWEVHQAGPRRLWDEAQVVHRWWDEHGRPAAHDWLWTVTPHGQTVTLTPDSVRA